MLLRPLHFLLIGFLALTPDLIQVAHAQTNGPTIAARAGEHPDFDRVVFDWPHNTKYSVSRDGDKVTVKFDGAGATRFGSDFAYLSRAHGFSSSTDADGHLTVSFVVDPKTSLKDFTSDKSIVIDIQKSATVNTAPAKVAAAPAEKPTPTKTEAKAEAVAPKQAAPAVQEPSKPTATKEVDATAPEPAKPTTAPIQLVTPKEPVPAADPVPAVTPAPAQTALMPAAQRASAPMAQLSPAARAAVASLQTDLNDIPVMVASLDPRVGVRAVIYMRAGYGYIIFDRRLTMSAEALTAGQAPSRVVLEPLDMPKNSGFRFAIPDNSEMRATHEGTAWQIFLSKQQPDVPVSTSLIAQPDFALGSRFLLPLPDAPDPIHFVDPIVGDELILVPFAENQAFSVGRRMADFQILPAAQGLVIKPLNEKLIVRSVTDGIEITADGGLHLSTTIDTGASQQSTQKAKAAAAGKSMFDFAAWRGKPDETFTKTRQRLQQTIVDVPEAERNRARLELARFYFAQGDGEEAAALLVYLAKQVPDLMAHADFLALLGASRILSYRPDEGLKNLDTPLLARQPEIELWQAVADGEMRNWQAAEEKFALTEGMLNGYPEPFYSRFAVLAIESALAMNKDREAADWLDRLENGPHRENINPAITYLRGVVHAKAGRTLPAEEAWKEVTTSNDRLYKIRAELALIDLGVSTGSLTPAQAADRLEALRFGWRGDDLEVDILHRLGQFYVQANNTKAGLNVLSRAVQLYPNSPLTPQIKDEMSAIFHDVFLGDLGKNLSPLDALTLYQQYRNLMPSGADGIAVTRNLAERLVAIDLLDQAANLLDDLVQNKLKGEEKARIGTRLAAIRILDHKPEGAITGLDYSNNDTLPAELVNERMLLRAKALADLKREDEALTLLQNNNSQAAKLLRADITMHAQRWAEAAKALQDLIGAPPKAGETLSADKAQFLVNCAIALSMLGDQTGLDRLAIDYGAAMAGTPQSDAFRVLTQPEKAGQLQDIAAAQARIADVDMFQGFLNNYRKTDDKPAAAAAPKK